MDKTPQLPGKFIWFEHASNDTAKARAFYEPLFGWHVESMPMAGQTYSMLMNGDRGIGGLTAAQPDVPNHWMSYISVIDVDDRFRAATAAGAKPLLPPTDFPPVGRGAGFTDPTGAAVCIWKSVNGDRPDDATTPVGDFTWNELWTPDQKTALAFYERVFAYTHDVMSMGEQGDYLVIKSPDGRTRGGIFGSTTPGTPPMWLPYVRVADCDATLAKAQSLGAQQVIMPPTDIPNVGRFALVLDPLRAAIAFITPVQA
ncbi:MAG TPA: VOC family protein [Burkholderiaceae bacterium]|nr:VOC family protein [Burkholderiaceae bacterium]